MESFREKVTNQSVVMEVEVEFARAWTPPGLGGNHKG